MTLYAILLFLSGGLAVVGAAVALLASQTYTSLLEQQGLLIDPQMLRTFTWIAAGVSVVMAAIDLAMEQYDSRRINNHILSRERVRQLLQLLAPMTPAERLTVIGLEPGREDLIIAGILITLRTMEILDFPSFTVSDAGLLEGLLLE